MIDLVESLFQSQTDWNTELIRLRRLFHQCPETAWTEFVTTAHIVEYFKQYNIPYKLGKEFVSKEDCYGREETAILQAKQRAKEEGVDSDLLEEMQQMTGAAALIDTGKQGDVVVLRFDIDGLKFHSKRRLHACGHDGHIALGLVLARFLWEHRQQFCGVVKLIFQPAEEGVMGGYAFSKSALLDDADYFLSGHLGMGNRTGEIVLGTNGFLATTKLDVTFIGKSSHAGASPEQGKNALLSACSAVLAMQNFCQDGRGVGRLNVGEFIAGGSRNIIPDRAFLRLETRGETSEIEQSIMEKVETCVQGASAMYGCTCQTKVVGRAQSATSDTKLAQQMKQRLEAHEYWARKGQMPVFYKERNFSASEDVTYYMNTVQKRGGKALYLGIGSDIQAPHHSENFDFDETSLQIGLEVYILIIAEILGI